MSPASPSKRPSLLLSAMDPRRSLMAGIVWLVIALTATFSIAASLWVGSVARENVFQQHVRRLSLETDQRASDLSQAVAARLDAVRAAQDNLRSGDSFDAQRARCARCSTGCAPRIPISIGSAWRIRPALWLPQAATFTRGTVLPERLGSHKGCTAPGSASSMRRPIPEARRRVRPRSIRTASAISPCRYATRAAGSSA